MARSLRIQADDSSGQHIAGVPVIDKDLTLQVPVCDTQW